MAITDLIPWRRDRIPVRREEEDLFVTFQRDMNRLFDEFFRREWRMPTPFGAAFGEQWTAFSPRVDVTETDEQVQVSAELPGLDAKDVDVTLSHGTLTISGEKKEEKEEQGKNYFRAERSYGSFKRSVSLPGTVETDKAEAEFKRGVLTITLPKRAKARDRKKITIKAK